MDDAQFSAEQVRLGALLDLVSAEIALEPDGPLLRGVCSFHPDVWRGFYLDPARGRYHCFSCGCGGDAVAWVMRTKDMDRENAVAILAERAALRPA